MLKAFLFEPVAPSHRYPGLVPKWFSGGAGLVYSDLRRRVPNENKRDGHIVSKKAAVQQGYPTTPLSSVYRSALQSRPHVSPSPSVTPRRSCDRRVTIRNLIVLASDLIRVFQTSLPL